MNNTYFQPSTTPVKAIEHVTVAGQHPMMRQYRPGYEGFMARIPIILMGDDMLESKVDRTTKVMQELASVLPKEEWLHNADPGAGSFARNILAIEQPEVRDCQQDVKEGVELLVALWGDGFTSPVHGHSDGFMHENILMGRMRVNLYRMFDEERGIVRPLETIIQDRGTLVSKYTKPRTHKKWKRDNIIHNFTAVGYSASLHYLPEHTRDGRDNGFTVQYFEDVYPLSDQEFHPLDSKQAMYSPIGTVILVRSTNVPEYGDHYIVITGTPVLKAHGFRPQDRAIQAHGKATEILDDAAFYNGVKLLKLSKEATKDFHQFHGIQVVNNRVIFPEA